MLMFRCERVLKDVGWIRSRGEIGLELGMSPVFIFRVTKVGLDISLQIQK